MTTTSTSFMRHKMYTRNLSDAPAHFSSKHTPGNELTVVYLHNKTCCCRGGFLYSDHYRQWTVSIEQIPLLPWHHSPLGWAATISCFPTSLIFSISSLHNHMEDGRWVDSVTTEGVIKMIPVYNITPLCINSLSKCPIYCNIQQQVLFLF